MLKLIWSLKFQHLDLDFSLLVFSAILRFADSFSWKRCDLHFCGVSVCNIPIIGPLQIRNYHSSHAATAFPSNAPIVPGCYTAPYCHNNVYFSPRWTRGQYALCSSPQWTKAQYALAFYKDGQGFSTPLLYTKMDKGSACLYFSPRWTRAQYPFCFSPRWIRVQYTLAFHQDGQGLSIPFALYRDGKGSACTCFSPRWTSVQYVLVLHQDGQGLSMILLYTKMNKAHYSLAFHQDGEGLSMPLVPSSALTQHSDILNHLCPEALGHYSTFSQLMFLPFWLFHFLLPFSFFFLSFHLPFLLFILLSPFLSFFLIPSFFLSSFQSLSTNCWCIIPHNSATQWSLYLPLPR